MNKWKNNPQKQTERGNTLKDERKKKERKNDRKKEGRKEGGKEGGREGGREERKRTPSTYLYLKL
jgi:hypothetical protein